MFDCIIPAYNEEGRVGKVIHEVLKCKKIKRIVVVDDGSKDKTWNEIVRISKLSDRVIPIRNKTNIGKTASVKKAEKYCSSEKILLIDADISITSEIICKFIDKVDGYDMLVYYRETDEQAIQRLWRTLFMSQLLYSGVRVVRREYLSKLRKGRYVLENELNRIGFKGKIGVFVGPYFFHYEKYKKMPLCFAIFHQAKMIVEIIHRVGLPEIIRQMVKFKVLLRHAEVME